MGVSNSCHRLHIANLHWCSREVDLVQLGCLDKLLQKGVAGGGCNCGPLNLVTIGPNLCLTTVPLLGGRRQHGCLGELRQQAPAPFLDGAQGALCKQAKDTNRHAPLFDGALLFHCGWYAYTVLSLLHARRNGCCAHRDMSNIIITA